ncbi:extracellular factor (EF) 3-hydroxypalmitic acid methyl ester biosynthesis protein [Roseimicrobium gellanilyticum]|uniref:Extracellular factor (EF) 3-hydroxypalmitic acid methyl ester biosynthesis protein n=1 Tax=Roseimicrobium gellanilyticum TaxID=748857 RepID=A0A366HPL3_9BACT|nr:class I SAM-dependent methyltransferase [Roseimicrobium gellanilyticum]RBP44400.1 extracellular factor (EF) 3-hydroxypalmitic acid methyl ester biosynthesis protein [Roseimicrobium gellanilyticum]
MENSENPLPINTSGGERLSLIICRNSQGAEVRGTLHRLTRYLAVFEVYNPYSIVQLSEVLNDFRILMNERVVYSGRAVIANLVNTGIMLICEASLADDGWIDVDILAPAQNKDRLLSEFAEFLRETEKNYAVAPDFKLVVADIHTLLSDLRRWMEQVELGVRSLPAGDRLTAERETIKQLEVPIIPAVTPLLERFETTAVSIAPELQPVHSSYIKRQIHPLVLCSPFVYRIFQKPLGYAGDYEMVSMMLRDPYEGSSMFAKILNRLFLDIPPVVAHRNRITYLTERLHNETSRVTNQGKIARIFNLGCGPAKEVQEFLITDGLSDNAELSLLDFNDETITNTTRILEDLRGRHRRRTGLKFIKRSVHQILKESSKKGAGFEVGGYDFVYCAGLFDYLSDRICRRLMEVFYDLLAPGGLLVATNVDTSNPSRLWMEYVVEWHLVYRNKQQFLRLAPESAPPGSCSVSSDSTGVNIFLEVRKPENG